MTEEQADKMIDLLEQVVSKLNDLEAAAMYADTGAVVGAIEDLKRYLSN